MSLYLTYRVTTCYELGLSFLGFLSKNSARSTTDMFNARESTSSEKNNYLNCIKNGHILH